MSGKPSVAHLVKEYAPALGRLRQAIGGINMKPKKLISLRAFVAALADADAFQETSATN